jgi:radical SAM superfamily enzyme YgiQ (UPF0313 family)
MNVLLISTYDLGRQPFGLASPAAWLRRAGARVECLDLSRQALDAQAVRAADFVAFFLPMHTATRLAVAALPRLRALNPRARLGFYGLYAPVNESYLRSLGAEVVVGGEFESALTAAVASLERGAAPPPGPSVSLARQEFLVPDRRGLPPLARYARLNLPAEGLPWLDRDQPLSHQRVVGSTQASRGCRHLCRHCPIVPVYNGRFRIVAKEVVLEDIRRQVASGARHMTFGDPDFFNGPRHALELVRALHAEHPQLTYDVTIKIEHLLERAQHLSALRETGCLWVTGAAESFDDAVLRRLAKGHTAADFAAVLELCREVGLVLAPTFVAFTPWTTLEGYCRFLERLAELDLIEHVPAIQLAIRLLIPAGSRLLELREVRERLGVFDPSALAFPWVHDDPRVDALAARLQEIIQKSERSGVARRALFRRVWRFAHEAARLPAPRLPSPAPRLARAAIPYLTEPWYC